MKYIAVILAIFLGSCKKNDAGNSTPPAFVLQKTSVDGVENGNSYNNVGKKPVIRFYFSGGAIDKSTVASNVFFTDDKVGASVPFSLSYDNDSTMVIQPGIDLVFLSKYNINIFLGLKSVTGVVLKQAVLVKLITAIDPTDKFPRISDDALLDLVQKQTFKYFWDFAHPVSGLARERETSGDLVTSGGSGFGIMGIVVAANRGFVTHAEALARMQKIVDFLKNKADKFHGAFPHWLDGNTGKVIPFSTKDGGADLVETSFLMQGLLTARQYFNGADPAETSLRSDINLLWNAVEWNWFRENNENVLYWHWSPKYNWDMNAQVRGWNEALITYVMAASSVNYSIPKIVYEQGWASNGAIRNGNTYYGLQLPLGPSKGGPLFFAHYSFLGINPHDLTDAYANYWDQNKNHSLINYNHCRTNPGKFYGYGDSCWGLTASDDNKHGYMAHEPNNDDGVISPTAALSSFPYTPTESMQALKFFYYTLGDRLWKEYGFVDAFNLTDLWFANSFLAIDQGPIIVMIENYRSGLLWNLFMSCPEVKTGMKSLGFASPNL